MKNTVEISVTISLLEHIKLLFQKLKSSLKGNEGLVILFRVMCISRYFEKFVGKQRDPKSLKINLLLLIIIHYL